MLFILLFSLGLVYSSTLAIVEERIHLVEYALLGILVSHDLRHSKPQVSVIGAVIFGSMIGICDELIQWALPYRVGDFRDVMFDILGTLWGASM